ncbi:MAG: hypothetical protein U0892_06285 [Pirellulales bacterium]
MTSGKLDEWIYAGYCPVCQCGLRRIRACDGIACDEIAGSVGDIHGYVLCDDCETMWLTPDENTRYRPVDSESPVCPVCSAPLYGPHARWATSADVEELGWTNMVTIENKHESRDTTQLLELDDMAIDLDAVPQPDATGDEAMIANSISAAERLAEAATQFDSGEDDEQDEPKPGC